MAPWGALHPQLLFGAPALQPSRAACPWPLARPLIGCKTVCVMVDKDQLLTGSLRGDATIMGGAALCAAYSMPRAGEEPRRSRRMLCAAGAAGGARQGWAHLMRQIIDTSRGQPVGKGGLSLATCPALDRRRGRVI